MLEMRIKNRPGYKICPHCKIEFLRNEKNFIIIKKTGHVNGTCRKCNTAYKMKRYRTLGKEAVCNTCKGIYIAPQDYKNSEERKFCSKICSYAFRSIDQETLLSIRGLEDLNAYNVINQREY